MDDTKLALEAVFVRTTKALETESAIEGLLSEPETNLDIRRQRFVYFAFWSDFDIMLS